MAIFTVTSGTNAADDGLVSFEEAVAMAAATPGADTIRFAAPLAIALAEAVTIGAAGGPLTIEGDVDNDGLGDIYLMGTGNHHLTIEAGATVRISDIEFINGRENGADGSFGAGAPIATHGASAPAATGFDQNGTTGESGGEGGHGGVGSAGESGAGAIVNSGTLTLERVGFGSNEYFAGNGGNGGSGGRGGNGGTGGRGGPGGGDGGAGGNGGNGGTGGDGGKGGDAAGAILNQAGATLTLIDTIFGGRLGSGLIYEGNEGQGGDAGNGGFGGTGGTAGYGGNGTHDAVVSIDQNVGSVRIWPVAYGPYPGDPTDPRIVTVPYDRYNSTDAGKGGDAGSAGAGGNAGANGFGGHAAGAVLNRGTVTGIAAVTADNTAEGGPGRGERYQPDADRRGQGGAGADGGIGGQETRLFAVTSPVISDGDQILSPLSPGFYDPAAAPDGRDAAAGPRGLGNAMGTAGSSDPGIVHAGGSGEVRDYATLVYARGLGVNAVGDTLSFLIARVGDVSQAVTVRWQLLPAGGGASVDGGDFVGGLPSGTVTFAALDASVNFDREHSVARINLALNAAGLSSVPEGYRFVLSNLVGGSASAGLGTSVVTGTLTGNGPPPPGPGPDTLTGGPGPDILNGLGGADRMIGLGGNDTYHVDNPRDVVIEARGGGRDTVLTTVSYTLGAGQEIEVLKAAVPGGRAPLKLTGNGFANTIVGNAGNNVIDGKGGADRMQGLKGNDTYHVDNARDVVIEARGGGRDTVLTKVSYTLAARQEIEVLKAAVPNAKTALTLTGNEFSNTIVGNNGKNVLDGGKGLDVLTGRGGDDTFVFSTKPAAGNLDRITDFTVGDDVLHLARSAFKGLAAGALAETAFKDIGVAGATLDASDRILYNSKTGALLYDRDGSGGADAIQFALLVNKAAIDAHDIFVV
ncbi:calcium-binding protein [Ensifer soli]|uniref:hypothetical protein n=1 Tax=Ciceribacter sp. sgz301302 TaxID=3342379 RepID=UPI0035B84551